MQKSSKHFNEIKRSGLIGSEVFAGFPHGQG